MNNGDKVSVIVPVYNTEPYLPRCITSLLEQTYQNIEVILVDDGSTDGSGSLCDAYQKKDQRIRVFHKENGGASSARNLGLDVAAGEWISFVDSDDSIELTMIEELMMAVKNNGVSLALCGRTELYEEKNRPAVIVCPQEAGTLSSEACIVRMSRGGGR